MSLPVVECVADQGVELLRAFGGFQNALRSDVVMAKCRGNKACAGESQRGVGMT